jgi:hypothetical protein
MNDGVLPPFDPAGSCPKCGGEIVSAIWHASAVLDYQSPCCRRLESTGQNDEHMCRRCERCTYGWVENVLTADDAEREERLMTIRKTGTADGGQPLETEDTLAKTGTARGWAADDEDALVQENAAADQE